MPDLLIVLIVLVTLGALLWELPVGPAHRRRMRRHMIAQLDPELPPDQRAQAVAQVREMIPLRGMPTGTRTAPPPPPRGADPTELRFDIQIPPTPDGCPGVRLRVPWHPVAAPAAVGFDEVTYG